MKNYEMNHLVEKLKGKTAQQQPVQGTDLVEKRQRLLEAEKQRIEHLKAIIPSWLEVMTLADYPEIELVTAYTETTIKKLFASRTERHVDEYAGWPVGSHHSRGGPPGYGGCSTLWLLTDGRLLKSSVRWSDMYSGVIHNNFPPESLFHQIGEHRPELVLRRGRPRVYHDEWALAELNILNNLKTIACKVGVSWDSVETIPSS